MAKQRKCLECSETYTSRQYNAEFCGTECRRKFNNRRAVRGALLYDLLMVAEVGPHTATHGEAPSVRAKERVKLALRHFIETDVKEGRTRSHKDAGTALVDTAYLTAVRVG